VIDVSMSSDWDFVVALSATGGVIALAILAYALLVYRRERADDRKAARDADAPVSAASREPVFFKRYLPPSEQ
jgi:hypothetical protein